MLSFMDAMKIERQIENINREIQQIQEVQANLSALHKEASTLSGNITRDVKQETGEDTWKGKKQQEYKDMYEGLNQTFSSLEGSIGQQVYFMDYWISHLENVRTRLHESLEEIKVALKKQDSTK